MNKKIYWHKFEGKEDISKEINEILEKNFKHVSRIDPDYGSMCTEKNKDVEKECTKLFERFIGCKIPYKHRFVKWQSCLASGQIVPHVDYKRRVALNYYVNTNKEKTVFYVPKFEEISCSLVDRYRTYDVNNIDQVTDFTAENHSMFLLDTDSIHSVEGFLPGKERIFLTCSFDVSFDDMIENLTR